MRTHTGEKPYSCQHCEYRANQSRHLQLHLRNKHNTGELELLRCDKCEYSTANRSHLTEHMRTHTNERPFSCDYCDYKAAQKVNLNRHIKRIHVNPASVTS